MDSVEIMKILPHRYPFLLVDGVLEKKEGEYIKAFKNVTINEPFFQGHFPAYPIMPGVLILEGLAQTAGLLFLKADKDDVVPLFIGVEKARFKREVKPGNVLIYEVNYTMERHGMIFVKAKASVEGKVCTVADLILGIKEGGE
ncbi:MAG: 3-hydroxyacyl-ACP dehydratase FabZ [Thermotogae bacterium]|nr:3-hydroxyacyl-ACP dehydratase FabZ [Thermotogota bacterium]